jgi:hypothetical protein
MSDNPYDVEWDDKAQDWLPASGRPGAATASWNGETWVRTGKNPEGPGALARGLATGWEQGKGLVLDAAPALAYSALGYDEDALRNLMAYKKRMDDLEARGLKSRVGLEDVKDLGSAGQFLLESVGEGAPSIVATMLTGGVGGIAGKAASAGAVAAAESAAARAAAQYGAGKAASGLVAKRASEIAQRTGLDVLDKQVQAQAVRQAYTELGQLAGFAVGSGIQNIPESFQNLYDETGELRPGAAFVAGSLKASLDMVTPIMLLRRTRGPEIADKVSDAIAAKLLKGRPGASGAVAGTLETLVSEGITEGSQTLIDELAKTILADKSVDWFNVLESAVKGGVGGAPFGAVAGYAGARQRQQREEAQAQLTEGQQQLLQQRAATEEALSLPEGYAQRKETGEFYDRAHYDRIADTFEKRIKGAEVLARQGKLDPQEVERLKAAVQENRTLAENAQRERLVSKLASHYNLNLEQEAALLRSSREEFEAFVRESLQDPTAVGRIPELQQVEFLTTEPGQPQRLMLPAPSPFLYEVPGVGRLTEKQADAVIDRWWKRSSLTEDMTSDREDKARQLNQLDPKINPQALNLDPNERRRLALNVIYGADNTQIVRAGEDFQGPTPSGTDTVPKLEPIDRVSPVGQAGPREAMPTLDNLYTRIVQSVPNAPTNLVDSKWLEQAAGIDDIQDEKQREAARQLIKQNAANIFRQLEADKFVTRRGFKFKVTPVGLRLQELGEAEVDRVLNLDTFNKALDEAASSGQRLGLGWLTRAIQKEALPGYPTRVLPDEAKRIWERLYQKGAVVPDGMYYRAVPRDQWVPKKPRVAPTPAVAPLDKDVGEPGKLPPNLPPAIWGYNQTQVMPNEPVRSNAETEKGIKAGWGKLKSLFAKYMTLRKVLVSEMYRTGMEHATLMDADTGDFVYSHTSNHPTKVGWPSLHLGTVQDPNRNFVFQHSHPNDSALSDADNSVMIQKPGIAAMVAHGAYGMDSAVFMHPTLRAYNRLQSLGDRLDMSDAVKRHFEAAYLELKNFIPQNMRMSLTHDQIFLMRVRLANLAVARTGLLDYVDTKSTADFAAINGWEKFIENFYKKSLKTTLSGVVSKLPKDVNKVREENGKEYLTRYSRDSADWSQSGGLEPLLARYTQSSGGATEAGRPAQVQRTPEGTRGDGGVGPQEGVRDNLSGGAGSLTDTGRRGFLKGVGKAAAAAKLPGVGLAQKVAKGVDLGRNFKLARRVLDAMDGVHNSVLSLRELSSSIRSTARQIRHPEFEQVFDNERLSSLERKIFDFLGKLDSFPSGTRLKVASRSSYLMGRDGDNMREVAPALMAQYDAILNADREIDKTMLGYQKKLYTSVDNLDKISNESYLTREIDTAFGNSINDIFSPRANAPYASSIEGTGGFSSLNSMQYSPFMGIWEKYIDPSATANYENLDKILAGLTNSGVLDNKESFSRYMIQAIRDPELVQFYRDHPFSLEVLYDDAQSLRSGLHVLKNFPVEQAETFLREMAQRTTDFKSRLNSVLDSVESNVSKLLTQLNSDLPRLASQRNNLVSKMRDVLDRMDRVTEPLESLDTEKLAREAVKAKRNFGGSWTTLGQEQAWEQLSKFFPEAKESGMVLPTRLPSGTKSPFEAMQRRADDEAAMSEAIPDDYSCR